MQIDLENCCICTIRYNVCTRFDCLEVMLESRVCRVWSSQNEDQVSAAQDFLHYLKEDKIFKKAPTGKESLIYEYDSTTKAEIKFYLKVTKFQDEESKENVTRQLFTVTKKNSGNSAINGVRAG